MEPIVPVALAYRLVLGGQDQEHLARKDIIEECAQMTQLRERLKRMKQARECMCVCVCARVCACVCV